VAARSRRLSAGSPVLGAALALALLGGTTAWAVGSADAADEDEQRRQAAAVTLSRFENRAEVLVRGLQSDAVAEPPMEPVAAAIEAVVRVPADGGQVRPLYRALPVGTDAAALVAASRTAMDLARDSGEPRAAAPRDGVVVIAVPEYRGGVVPPSTETKRQATVAWRLAVVHPERLLDDVVLPDGARTRMTLDAEGAADPDASITPVVAGQPWELAVDLPAASALSRGAVAVLGMSLLGAAVLLTAGTLGRRTLERERAATASLERETRTVAELGPLLQSSLDLAEVLPAVAVLLSDEFGLARLGVQLHGEHGRLVEVFAVGGRSGPPEDELAVVPATTHVPAGRPASLPLQRAGRTIGRLSLTPRRPLQQAQLAALSAAADLVAVATYNVELYEREQASVHRLRELDQLKDAFLGTISHELRTPITAIGGFVRLLRERWTDVTEEQRLEFLERVHRNSVSLGLLVDDLLDFARLERQALNAPASPVQLDQQVAGVLAQLAPILGEREMVTELEPVLALANTGALERVLANLLTNADKFSPAGSPVLVRLTSQAASATLEVVDEGPGIAPEDRDHVFTRFYRGDSNAARGTRGAGIGLSVVRELVKQMGGTVVALPNVPHGTRMVVTLARAGAVDLPAQERRSEPAPPAVVERSGT
jgi:signal transduction histidine kinase